MMDGFGVFLRKELREAWRTARLPVVVGIFFILGMLSPLAAKYTPELLKSLGSGIQIIVPPPQASDAIDQFLKNVGGDGVFIAILLAMGMVAREKERGTAAFVLAKPLSRPAFLLAKLVALALTLAAGVGVAGLATYIYTALLFKPVAVGGFIIACLLVLLMLLAYAAVTFLGSTLTRSSLPAAGIGLVGFAAVSLLGIFPRVQPYTPAALNDMARALPLGLSPHHVVEPLVATGVLIVAMGLLSWLAFRSQEQAPAS